MVDERAGATRRGLLAALVLLLVAVLVVGIVLGVRAVRADPAWGDTGTAGWIVGGGDPAGTRGEPGQVGEGTLHWETPQGGEVSLGVERAERVHRGSPDLRPEWEGPFPCQEYFLVEMTISYSGPGAWEPAEQLLVRRMTGPFGTDGPVAGAEILAQPLLIEGRALEDGDTVTGSVAFAGSSGTDWGHHLVIGTADGGWMHVEPGTGTEPSARC